MKKIKNRIYFDSWRRINSTLFEAYVDCYSQLAEDSSLNKKDVLYESFKEKGILLKYKLSQYGSAYIVARELGVFYNCKKGEYHLGQKIKDFIGGNITYTEYMKGYCISYQALINNSIIFPLQIVLTHSLKRGEKKTINEIFDNCKYFFSDGYAKNDELALDSLKIFLGRACEAQLIQIDNNKYSVISEDIYSHDFIPLTKNSNEFTDFFLNGTITDQQNLVLKMINSNNYTVNKKFTKNQILYGPPGTGKTYSTITRALDILGLLPKDYDSNKYSEAKEIFKKQLGTRIEFVTMHQSYSYEDFVQGLKPIVDDKNRTSVMFDYIPGVFKKISDRAQESKDMLDISSSNVKDKDLRFPSYMLSIDEHFLRKEIFQLQNNENGEVPQRLAFEFFNNIIGKGYCKVWRDKFDRLLDESPRLGFDEDKFSKGELEEFTNLILEYQKLTLEERRERMLNEWFDSDNQTEPIIESDTEKENYVIILDEINRCNISKVFGELITLIEDDKREDFVTTLPSGHSFSVAKNLYIIGTMNTADKSVSMIDIALRRRFEFEALYPDIDLVTDVKKKEFMRKINKVIKNKKSIDFQIGHSDFMKDLTIVETINKKTIPLLVEYFRSDMQEIKSILESTLPNSISIDDKWYKDKGLLRVG
jgi:Cdc6-like AAA superfamily ATPase